MPEEPHPVMDIRVTGRAEVCTVPVPRTPPEGRAHERTATLGRVRVDQTPEAVRRRLRRHSMITGKRLRPPSHSASVALIVAMLGFASGCAGHDDELSRPTASSSAQTGAESSAGEPMDSTASGDSEASTESSAGEPTDSTASGDAEASTAAPSDDEPPSSASTTSNASSLPSQEDSSSAEEESGQLGDRPANPSSQSPEEFTISLNGPTFESGVGSWSRPSTPTSARTGFKQFPSR
jgi:hypothetical protein